MATGTSHTHVSRQASADLILKEGFLYKKGGVIKSWSRRYFILMGQSLCYFKREFETQEGLEPLGRIFLSDIVNIQTEGVEKRKAFVFALHTKKRAVLLQAANSEDRDKWVDAIRNTLESDKEAERKDPFRKTLRKLAPGLKRVTLVKDPDKGIGCTIKNAAGHIFVNRIVEDGPIAHTGVLRPGDEILDIHGSPVTGLVVAEVVGIIRAAPNQFLATVRPITALKMGHVQDTGRITYSDVILQPTSAASSNGSAPHAQALGPSSNKSLTVSQSSLDDVGNYDDEDEGDTPPPLPPRTEDALILVDPPPSTTPPSLPPKPHSPEHLLALTQQRQNSAGRVLTRQDRAKMMQKSLSQGDSIDQEDVVLGGRSGGYQRPPRIHHYEEIRPKIVYADLDHTPQRQSKTHTLH